MKIKYYLLPLCLASILSGCGTGSVSFREMSSAYREVVEGYSNDNILLNIVRSSKTMPLSFLDIPSVIGTGSVSGSLSLGGTMFSSNPASVAGFFSASGPGSSSSTGSASLSVSNNFTFTQSSLDNAQFLGSFLTPIQPQTIQNLINNDLFPKSILYTLVIDRIEILNPKGDTIKSFVNDPFDPNYKNFQVALYRLLDSGLATETTTQKQALSPPMTVKELNQNMSALVSSYALPGVTLLPADNSNPKNPTFQLARISSQSRMCLNKRSPETKIEDQFAETAFCSSTDTMSNGSNSDLQSKNKNSLAIKLRSTQKVFHFLGSLVDLQNSTNKVIRVKNSALFTLDPKIIDMPDDENNSFPLFVVEKNKSVSNPIAKVTYMGDTYSIPNDRKSASSTVFTLVSGMLTLNKVSGSIPPSPSVLIK